MKDIAAMLRSSAACMKLGGEIESGICTPPQILIRKGSNSRLIVSSNSPEMVDSTDSQKESLVALAVNAVSWGSVLSPVSPERMARVRRCAYACQFSCIGSAKSVVLWIDKTDIVL